MPAILDRYPTISKELPAALAETIGTQGALARARRGNDVVSPDDSSNPVYLLLEGRVQTRLITHDGTEAILRDLGPGAFFGELAAIDDGPRSAWVVALTDCVLARIPGKAFRAAVLGIPEVTEWMMTRLTAQIRDLTHRWFELNALQVRSRLHCELARMCGEENGTLILDPAPSHAELAARIGSHREAITREMGYLARNGIVEQVSPRRLAIHDPAALRRLADLATWGLEGGDAPGGAPAG